MRSFSILAVVVLLAAGILLPDTVEGHAQLESSWPPADALLAVPPEEITLRFTEPVDPSSVVVQLLGEDGSLMESGNAAVDPNDARAVRVPAQGIGFGITTVSWTTRSATDGHTLSGSFAFRVGGSSRAPAAATVEGDRPAPWNVATRWLTFLGLALAVGTLMVGGSARRQWIVLAGAVVALFASLAEPALLWLAPPEGWEAPTLPEAFAAQPWAWWLRPAAGLLICVLASVLRVKRANPDITDGNEELAGASSTAASTGRDESRGHEGGWLSRLTVSTTAVTVAGLVGLLGLALTAHAAGRETLRLPALASVLLHEWSVALWVGGLLLIVLDRTAEWTSELRRFSRLVLPIALLAIATGVTNAGFLFPSVDRFRAIRDSDYGWVLIAKVAVVGLVLALALLHRLRLRGDKPSSEALRISLPAEAIVVALVLVAAATLAMLAPPGEARDDLPVRVELALPFSPTVDDDQVYVQLAIEPGEDERRRLTVSATQGAPLATVPSVDGGYESVRAPILTDLQTARVTLSSLTSTIAPATYDLTAAGDGSFSRDGFVFAVAGWWQAEVTVRRPGIEDRTVTFYLLEPNPNVVGFDRVPEVESDPAAEAIQAGARAAFDARSSYTYVEQLNGGNGGVEVIQLRYADNAAGSGLRAVEISSHELTLVRLDGTRYVRQGDGDWIETGDSPVLTPAEVAADFDGAEQVRLAGEEEIDGELCRRITFHVPATSVAAAWYVWWVSVETGELKQEAMVSRSHYMIKRYTDVNVPATIEAPT